MNVTTPRVFVAATQQHDGKTTVALGMFAALKKRIGRIGFIKPVGQRFIEVEGKQIDEDTVLIDRTFGVQTPLEDMSPIAVEPDFTRKYIRQANSEFLTKRLQNSFDRAAWEKEFVIIEGTGHAGVGSVFDLSNARVAKLLGSKVLLVTKGGIGRAIDEVALNLALFEKEGVEVIGVILNKVLPAKMAQAEEFTRPGLQRLGVDLLGIVPLEPVLTDSTLGQVCHEIKGDFLNARSQSHRRVKKVIIGAMNSTHVMAYFERGTLVITPGDREDIILAALSTSTLAEAEGKAIAGLVLSGDLLPHQNVLDLIHASEVPVIAASSDSYTVASKIYSMTVKTLPEDGDKIRKIQALIEQHVEIDRVMEKLRG